MSRESENLLAIDQEALIERNKMKATHVETNHLEISCVPELPLLETTPTEAMHAQPAVVRATRGAQTLKSKVEKDDLNDLWIRNNVQASILGARWII